MIRSNPYMRLWFRAIGYEWLLSPLIPQPNSRLGCQITVTEAVGGLVVRLPLGQH